MFGAPGAANLCTEVLQRPHRRQLRVQHVAEIEDVFAVAIFDHQDRRKRCAACGTIRPDEVDKIALP